MKDFIQRTGITVGDILTRTKSGFLIEHHTVFAGYCRKTGIAMMAENQLGHGTRLIALSQFLQESRLTGIKRYGYSLYKQEKVIQNILKCLGTKYNLLTYNCEHFAYEVSTGNKRSLQVENGVAIAFGIFSIGMLLNIASK